ncbi:DUF6879 family protein [Nocardia violaceofusca]|uniref:DUF6879 family protein n=1 Tax=Nocardia violaceofusca TaxID=941182 RepID=UPI0007C70BA5|nr:DUF6879 family protein [Nocardia violaceofusca]
MRLYSRTELPQLLGLATSRACHLETRDEYRSDSEHSAMLQFLDGEIDDPGGAWFDPWARTVADLVGRGVAVQRARIVSVPLTDYTRYLIALTPHNLEAGEDVRWLARDHADRADAAADDFWLIDDHTVAYSVFDADGWWSGVAATSDAQIVGYACALWDRVWHKSVSHEHFRT